MGTKFANIQVQTRDVKEIEKCISVIKKKSGISSPIFKNIGVSNVLKSIGIESPNTYFIGQFSEEWVTILNNNFEWEVIVDEAIKLSRVINYPIIAVGYFDDDLLEITLIKNGEVLTFHRQGDVGYYGINESNIDIDKLCEVLKVWNIKDKLKLTFESSDLEEIIDSLEKLFEIPIWIKSDWLQDYDNDIKDKFVII